MIAKPEKVGFSSSRPARIGEHLERLRVLTYASLID